jgi:hypothetical protein
MNSSYLQKNINHLRVFLVKEVVPHIEKWEKLEPLNVLWKSSGIWAFESLQKLGGLNLDLFYTVIFFRGTN